MWVVQEITPIFELKKQTSESKILVLYTFKTYTFILHYYIVTIKIEALIIRMNTF